ncbi:hypothetical protein R0K05_02185 [Planococcus sp. SIMBA_160]
MDTLLIIAIIGVAVFVGIASKKFYDKPYVLNFGIAALMLLLVLQSLIMQPITVLGYIAIAVCSIAFVFQVVIGYRNWKGLDYSKA